MYDNAQEAASTIRRTFHREAKTAIVLGSGLGAILDWLEDAEELAYEDIPHFPISTVSGHTSKLVSGVLNGTDVLIMSGRFHYYEGYSMQDVTFPLYVFQLLGIENLILTNSCGGINTEKLEPGSIMVIKDFINLMPSNPLIGPNDERFGPRFPDMTEPYSLELRGLALEKARDMRIDYVEGVYAGFMGPYYETKAEIEMIRRMGGEAVGMSTVPETIVANYLGMKVLAFATITNMATGIQRVKHSHENVVKMAGIASKTLAEWIRKVVGEL